jgi:lyso-ornithine lipid O-acyltransferase
MLLSLSKLVFLGCLIILAAPLQMVLIRFFPRFSGILPHFTHRLFIFLFSLKIEEIGQPPCKGRPALIVSNHISWLDIPILGALHPLSFIAKSDIARWPIAGWLAFLQRSVFIDRSRKTATMQTNHIIRNRLRQGDHIVLFAEGTTSDGVRLLPFRASLLGAARSVFDHDPQATLWIQPVAITYLRRDGLPLDRRYRPEIAWYGDMELSSHFKTFLRRSLLDIQVTWCEPMLFNGTSNRKIVSEQAKMAVYDAILRNF